MNDLQERLRTVTHAAGEQITPDRIPPLPPLERRRTYRRLARLTGAGAPRLRPWPARLAPLAAAVAVVALVAGSLTLAHAVGLSDPARTGPGPSSASAAANRVPPWYASLAYSQTLGYAQPGPVMFRRTATGAVRTTVQPPSGEDFTALSGADDDSTFVAAAATTGQVTQRIGDAGTASGTGTATSDTDVSTSTSTQKVTAPVLSAPARFYLLRFDAHTGVARLSSPHIPALANMTDFALSPDGASLAVALATAQTMSLRVYSLASGSSVTWTAATHQGGHDRYLGIGSLSWTRGGGLAFGLVSAGQAGTPFGVLDTATAGGNLFGHSAMYPPGTCYPSLVTQNGELIITTQTSATGDFLLRECTISHGHVTVTVPGRAVSYQHGAVDVQGPLWASPTGHKLILAGSIGAVHRSVTGVLHGTVLDALPGKRPIPTFSAFPGQPVSW
jgi:hypothetical protein